MKTKHKFIAKGIVAGNCWGGGVCGYATKRIEEDTEELLIKKAESMLRDGSLDSGMGFESLIGAVLDVEHVKTVEIDGEEYCNSEYNLVSIGELTEEQNDWLDEAVLSQ